MNLQLPEPLKAKVEALAALPLRDRDLLVQEIGRHTRVIEIISKKRPLPLPLAQALARGLTDLVKGQSGDTPPDHQGAIQAAVQYYVENDDDDHDLESATGLDDDAQVFMAVAMAVNRGDLVAEVAALRKA